MALELPGNLRAHLDSGERFDGADGVNHDGHGLGHDLGGHDRDCGTRGTTPSPSAPPPSTATTRRQGRLSGAAACDQAGKQDD